MSMQKQAEARVSPKYLYGLVEPLVSGYIHLLAQKEKLEAQKGKIRSEIMEKLENAMGGANINIPDVVFNKILGAGLYRNKELGEFLFNVFYSDIEKMPVDDCMNIAMKCFGLSDLVAFERLVSDAMVFEDMTNDESYSGEHPHITGYLRKKYEKEAAFFKEFLKTQHDISGIELEKLKNSYSTFESWLKECCMNTSERRISHEGMIRAKPYLKRLREIYYHAKLERPLLIVGETGTSKSFMARAIHEISPRRIEKFIAINCAAIPENLIESELFGHEKGAFTGAVEDKKGILADADGGTVFLDELGNMPEFMQAKLLKVVEEKRFMPVGGMHKDEVRVDVRFIAAVQPEKQGKILHDLKYRMGNVIEMPTLRERIKITGRLPVYEVFFRLLNIYEDSQPGKIKMDSLFAINEDSWDILMDYDYPGNYRELENILLGAIISAKADNRDKILPEDLRLPVDDSRASRAEPEMGIQLGRRAGLLPVDANREPTGEPMTEKTGQIKLKDIAEFAEEEKKKIVKAKLNEVIKKGRDVKTVLMEEGLEGVQYQGYLKKLRRISGMSVREFKKKEGTGIQET